MSAEVPVVFSFGSLAAQGCVTGSSCALWDALPSLPAVLSADGGAQDGWSHGGQVRPDHRGAHCGDVEAGGRDGARGVALHRAPSGGASPQRLEYVLEPPDPVARRGSDMLKQKQPTAGDQDSPKLRERRGRLCDRAEHAGAQHCVD